MRASEFDLVWQEFQIIALWECYLHAQLAVYNTSKLGHSSLQTSHLYIQHYVKNLQFPRNYVISTFEWRSYQEPFRKVTTQIHPLRRVSTQHIYRSLLSTKVEVPILGNLYSTANSTVSCSIHSIQAFVLINRVIMLRERGRSKT